MKAGSPLLKSRFKYVLIVVTVLVLFFPYQLSKQKPEKTFVIAKEKSRESKLLSNENIRALYQSLERERKNNNNNNSTQYDMDTIFEGMVMNKMLEETKTTDLWSLREKTELHATLWRTLFGQVNENCSEQELEDYKQNLVEASQFMNILEKKNETKIENLEKKVANLSKNQRLFLLLHYHLYPWIYHKFKSLGELIQYPKGKGIVICTGELHYKYAISTIDALRNVLNSTLPIEVFYIGENDLSKAHRESIQQYEEVYLSDLTTFFSDDLLHIKGYAIKPYSVLASRFEEVLLIDADSLFLQPPEVIFDEPGYQKKGSLFFKDRTIPKDERNGLEWLKSWMIDPLPETRNSRYWRGESVHEMESSAVVLHKSKVLPALLATCKLNEDRIREEVVYKYVLGDKETFWMGFDMARQSYNMHKDPTSFLGEAEDYKGDKEISKSICGHIAHTLDGRLLYWNGHIALNKYSFNRKLIRMDGYTHEDDALGHWDKYYSCFLLKKPNLPTPFDEHDQAIIDAVIEREKTNHYIFS